MESMTGIKPVRVGLIGLGTVGSGVVKILQEHHDDFLRDQGVDIQLIAVASTDPAQAEALGVKEIFSTDGFKVIANPDVDIVIELVGGTGIALKFIQAALDANKRVVTANKAVMATSGHELLAVAGSKGLELAFEASVGGGIPIIGALRNSLIGNRIESVMGIVNGTTNYMLMRILDGLSYDDALKEAQELGYAEADPTADVEGHDAAAKNAILTTLAFNTEVVLEQVYTEGITKITPTDLAIASQLGYVVKLLAIANRTPEGIQMRTHPAMISKSHALANVNGVMNAIFVVGDAVGETMFYGAGAGSGPAASAVVGDLIEVAQRLTYGNLRPYIRFGTEQLPLVAIEDIATRYYLRLTVPDRVGIVAATAAAFADHGVSISRMQQADTAFGTEVAELIYMTHPAREGDLQAVLAQIKNASLLVSEPVIIRVED
ncbi:MAG: homoserine dehydrogenase [Coriobacteriales bacterium]|jgi:homoserine dehydrogenase|nr:homoserine dehydrogenase [Coriobacteriales bacterium]